MNEEVNLRGESDSIPEEILRLKNELAESAKTIRELSAQLGQAKSNNNLDINAVIRNVVQDEMQEIDIYAYEDQIENMIRSYVDVDDMAYDIAQKFDIYDYSDTIEEIAKQAIADTDFEVSIKD